MSTCDYLGFKLRLERFAHFLDEVVAGEGLPPGLTVGGEIQEIVHGRLQGSEAGGDFVHNVETFPSCDSRRRNKLMYNEIGTRLLRTSWATCEAIRPRSARRFLRQLAVFRRQFVGQSPHFVPQHGVRMFQPHRGRVPGGKDRFQVRCGIQGWQVGQHD